MAPAQLRRERRAEASEEAKLTGRSFYECWNPLAGPKTDGTIRTFLKKRREYQAAAEKAAAEAREKAEAPAPAEENAVQKDAPEKKPRRGSSRLKNLMGLSVIGSMLALVGGEGISRTR